MRSIATSSAPPSYCYTTYMMVPTSGKDYGSYDLYVVASSGWEYPSATVMAPSFRVNRDQFEELGHPCIQAAETITRRLLA